MDEVIKEQDHYNDGLVDMRSIDNGFSEPVIVFVNRDYECTTLAIETWWYTDNELLETYKRMFPKGWVSEEEQQKYIADFKQYLIEQGADLEEEGEEQ